MKALPILVVTNALALGLAGLLYLQQDEMKSQIAASRSGAGRRAQPAPDEDEIVERVLARLPSRAAAASSVGDARVEREPAAAPLAAADGRATPAGTQESAPPTFPSESGEAGSVADPAEMESFRRKVRLALDLNRDEDEVRGVVESIDGLVSKGQLGSISDVQKEKAARAVIQTRRKIPQVWQKVMGDPNNQTLGWDQRRQILQTEMGALRAAAQKEMEEYLPSPDAKKIADETLRDGAGMQRFRQGASEIVVPGRPAPPG